MDTPVTPMSRRLGPHINTPSHSTPPGAPPLQFYVASQDGLSWSHTSEVLMAWRAGCWDAPGVGTGPQALPLSSGNWLYVYKVDTRQYAPPLGRRALGWVIQDRDDPTRVLARTLEPLMTAVLPWEECLQENYTCQTTRVVWADGTRAVGGDAFDSVYGGGDTNTGVARIQVTVPAGR